jgi:Htaa
LIRATTIRLFAIAAGALALAAIALPAQSPAAISGTTKLKLDGPAAQALRDQGVSIAPVKPASGGPRQIGLPVAAGLAGSTTTLLRQRGGIKLSGEDGSARLGKLRVLIGKRSLLEAKLGGEEIELFKILGGGGKVDVANGSVRFDGLRLKLTRAGAKALAAKLGLESLPARRFGTLSTKLTGLAQGDSGKAGGGSAPSGPAQQSSACPLPSGAGPANEGTPPEAVRPPAAVDVTGASVSWHVRESFIRYIATGEGTTPTGGAVAAAPTLLPGASAALSYDFQFPFANGWLDSGADPASPADDRALLRFSGGLRFLYSGHGIDLATTSPEIEIDGGASRAIFAVSEGGGGAQRQVLVNLDLGRAGSITRSGSSYVYDRVPGAVPAGTASSTFAGFYSPGTDFGCFTVSFST